MANFSTTAELVITKVDDQVKIILISQLSKDS